MLQWFTALSFMAGVVIGYAGLLSWRVLVVSLVVGLLLFCLMRGRRVGYLQCVFVFNVTLLGALWYHVRTGGQENKDDKEESFVSKVSQRASGYAKTCLMESGLRESDVVVLNAMLLGNRKDLPREEKLRFRNAGVQHLLALSGLHLGILIVMLSFLYLRRARFSRWRWHILVPTLLLLWGYCVLAGMPQSLLRAMLMTTLYFVSLYRSSQSHTDITFANTLFLMLLIDPLSLFDIGAQLSFAAVAALIWISPEVCAIFPSQSFPDSHLGKFLHRLWQLFGVSLSAWLGTMPLCLFYFQQFQPWQPLVSVVLVPLASILLYIAVLLLLAAVTHLHILALPLAKVVSYVMILLNTLLDEAGRLPCATVKYKGFSVPEVIVFYLILIAMRVGLQGSFKVILFAIFTVIVGFGVLCLCRYSATI